MLSWRLLHGALHSFGHHLRVEGDLGELRPNVSDLFIWARYYIELTDDTVANHQLVRLHLLLALLHVVLLAGLLLVHLGRGVLANGLEQEDIDRDDATVDTNDLVLERDKELDMEHDEEQNTHKKIGDRRLHQTFNFFKVVI